MATVTTRAFLNGSPGSGLLLWLGMIAVALAYAPGLAGEFLLDDWQVLPALGAHGGIRDLPTFLLYLSSGDGIAAGRPLTLLSYLIDATDWPADPKSFRRTSLLLHLLNSGLLCCALYRLGLRCAMAEQVAARSAVLAAIFWMAHPLLVSTTLYAAQRSAILATTFFLLALLTWEQGWRALEAGKLRTAWIFSFGLVGLATLCAFLSKENGALTPLLLTLAWALFYRPSRASLAPSALNSEHRIRQLGLYMPIALLAVALVWAVIVSFQYAPEMRPWSLQARALTLPRVLIDYIGLLLVPREGSRGLFTDDFVLSNGLVSPPSTLVCIGLVTALLLVAWKLRSHRPFAMAVFFFFLGHSLEGGLLNLEPYFEHRNYLPALFLFWPVALALIKPSSQLGLLRCIVAVAISITLLLTTSVRARSFASTNELARLATIRNPNSVRAQLMASAIDIAEGRQKQAERQLYAALRHSPDQPLLVFNLAQAQCLMGNVTEATLDEAGKALRRFQPWDRKVYHWLSGRIAAATTGECKGLTLRQLGSLVAALAANTRLMASSNARQDLFALRGELELAAGKLARADAWFKKSLLLHPSLEACLWLASRYGYHQQARFGVRFIQSHRSCRNDQRTVPMGMGRLHRILLEEFPEHDSVNRALSYALSGHGLLAADGTEFTAANSRPNHAPNLHSTTSAPIENPSPPRK